MTDSEYRQELINRLRRQFQLWESDCTDDEILHFGKATLRGNLIEAGLRCHMLMLMFSQVLPWNKPYEREYYRYKSLYSTLLAENRSLHRRVRALRGSLKVIRAERRAKGRGDSRGAEH